MKAKIQHTPTPALNQYDFDGACAPHCAHYSGWSDTFSLGIFQWLPKAGGKGLKRGKVIFRVKGYTGDPEPAYQRARELAAKYNTNL